MGRDRDKPWRRGLGFNPDHRQRAMLGGGGGEFWPAMSVAVPVIDPHRRLNLEDCGLRVDIALGNGFFDGVEKVRYDGSTLTVDLRVVDRDNPCNNLLIRFLMAADRLEDAPESIQAATVRRALQLAVLHELDEAISVRGKRVFDPHGGVATAQRLEQDVIDLDAYARDVAGRR